MSSMNLSGYVGLYLRAVQYSLLRAV